MTVHMTRHTNNPTNRPMTGPSTAPLTNAVRAEWTKLRSVRSTVVALLAMVALTFLIGLLTAQGGKFGYGGPQHADAFTFVHRPVTGDTTLTAQVTSQSDSAPWAKAGVILKADTLSGSASVSLMLTPGHGVRMQADGTTEITGPAVEAPYWLRLVRSGSRVTGLTSADGRVWDTVSTVTDRGLPATAEAGLFVASPNVAESHWAGPGKLVGNLQHTTGRAVFAQVALAPAAPRTTGGWQSADVVQDTSSQPGDGGGPASAEPATPGTAAQRAGTFTVTGSGDLGSPGIGGVGADAREGADPVADSLSGAQIALFAVIALGVLAVTSEYRTRTIRTTFTVSPHRSRVLAAKAVVLAAGVFAAGLVAAATAFLVAAPIQRDNGYAPPIFPERSLTDPDVLRAVVGTAVFLALIALLSLGVGVIVRRTTVAVIVLFTVLVVIPLVASVTSVGANQWVGRLTPIAGAAIRQTQPLFENAIGPWPGLAVLAGYTAAVLATAFWLQRGRDA